MQKTNAMRMLDKEKIEYQIYEYDSNEYHNRIECTVITYRCCGNTMLTIPDYSTAVLEEHEIHPSVDMECEIEGPCIHCGETIYW